MSSVAFIIIRVAPAGRTLLLYFVFQINKQTNKQTNHRFTVRERDVCAGVVSQTDFDGVEAFPTRRIIMNAVESVCNSALFGIDLYDSK